MTFPGLVAANNLSDVVDRERAWNNIGSGIASNYLPETYYDNVSLLLHGDGINGSTTIIDSSLTPKTVTAAGNAKISTAQSKFGGSSILFDGNGDYLSTSALGLVSTDFTIEFWIYLTAGGPANQVVCTSYKSPIQLNTFIIARTSTNVITFQDPFGAGSVTSSLTAGTWHHIACTYISSSRAFKIFANGVGSPSSTGTAITAQWSSFFVGGSPGDNNIGTWWLNGYIDDLRITKGVARYTSNFTPPTAPFPPVLSIPTTATIKGADILALEGVRNASTRDFIFTKGLTSAAQPRITSASVATASGTFLRDNALLKTAPVSSGNYFFSSGLTLSGISAQINGTNALSIASAPFSGSTATTSLLFSELRPQANWRITEPMTAGTLASPELAVPFETEDFVLYMKAGQN